MIEMRHLKNLVIFFQTILSSSIYYSQKRLKHFSLEILVIDEILEHIFLNIFKYISRHICTEIKKQKI